MRNTRNQQLVMNCFKKTKRPLCIEELQQRLPSMNRNTLNQICSLAAKEGQLKRVALGVYDIVPERKPTNIDDGQESIQWDPATLADLSPLPELDKRNSKPFKLFRIDMLISDVETDERMEQIKEVIEIFKLEHEDVRFHDPCDAGPECVVGARFKE